MMKMMKRELLRPEGWWQSWFSSSATAPALPHSFSFLGDEGTNMNSSLNIQQRQKWLLSASDNFSLLKTSEEESWPTVISSDLSVVLSSESFHCEWKCWFSKLREFVHVEEEAQLAFFASSSDPAAPSSLIPNSCWWSCKHCRCCPGLFSQLVNYFLLLFTSSVDIHYWMESFETIHGSGVFYDVVCWPRLARSGWTESWGSWCRAWFVFLWSPLWSRVTSQHWHS